MNRWAIRLIALGGFLTVGAQPQAHHAVASAYDSTAAESTAAAGTRISA